MYHPFLSAIGNVRCVEDNSVLKLKPNNVCVDFSKRIRKKKIWILTQLLKKLTKGFLARGVEMKGLMSDIGKATLIALGLIAFLTLVWLCGRSELGG